jgi:hypothetical protein
MTLRFINRLAHAVRSKPRAIAAKEWFWRCKTTIFWVAVSSVPFGIAANLTESTTFINKTLPPLYEIAVYAKAGDKEAETATVSYRELGDQPFLVFEIKPKGSVAFITGLKGYLAADVPWLLPRFRNNEGNDASCFEYTYPQLADSPIPYLQAGEVGTIRRIGSPSYHYFRIAGPHFDDRGLWCALSSLSFKETYTFRGIRFRNRPRWEYGGDVHPPSGLELLETGPNPFGPDPPERVDPATGEGYPWYFPKGIADKSALPLRLDFSQLARSQDIHFHGEGFVPAQVESERTSILPPWDTVTVEWKDIDADQQRDRLFILIGVLIAVGAAMLVEALKPWAEHYLHRR